MGGLREDSEGRGLVAAVAIALDGVEVVQTGLNILDRHRHQTLGSLLARLLKPE